MFGKIDNIQICGIHAVVPNKQICNMESYAEKFGEKKLKRQIRMTGVEKRYVTETGLTSAKLCEIAAKHLLNELKWSRESIRALLYVTETPSYILPSTAFSIQHSLGLGEDCVVYDLNLGCSGWIVGMQTISAILHTIEPNDHEPLRALLLTGSLSTTHIAEDDISMAMLFGDAGAATAIELSDAENDLVYTQKSNGGGYQHIFMENSSGSVQMNGPAVFEFTLNQVLESIKSYTEHFNIQDNDIDYYVFHQAQKFIIDNLVELLGYPPEKVLSSYANYGNTAAAAIPVTLSANADTLKKKPRVSMMTAGFGAGLSWGALQFSMYTEHIIAPAVFK